MQDPQHKTYEKYYFLGSRISLVNWPPLVTESAFSCATNYENSPSLVYRWLNKQAPNNYLNNNSTCLKLDLTWFRKKTESSTLVCDPWVQDSLETALLILSHRLRSWQQGSKHPSMLTADHCHATGFDGYGQYDLQEQHKLALAWLGF